MPLDDHILDQAATWAARTGDPSFDDWDGFTLWLEGDPAHARAYDAVIACADDAAEALAAAQPANDDVPVKPARRRFLMGAFTAALVGVAAFSLWQVRGGTYTVETAPGETRLIALGDGDEITLGGGSTITLDRSDPRFARLEGGQALFSVRHDASRPFRVDVGEDELVDLGTVFDVRFGEDGHMTVAVSEGVVAFNPSRENVKVVPGKYLSSAEGSREYQLGDIPGSEVGGWRMGRLTFQGATLSAVAEDLTRATGTQFAAAPGASRRRVSGSLLIDPVRDDPGSVGALLGVKVRKSNEGWVFDTK